MTHEGIADLHVTSRDWVINMASSQQSGEIMGDI